ncbi:O-antigen polysaccharide polymerase Wzy family protein, partial [Enterococcus faecalis]|nr:O-antigen polysaccharide polymerase Wzy family protein [Enterococcus faecalis]
CIFLACMPKKIYGYIALSLSIIGSIPLLLMGQRGPFMLKVLFALIYFIIRDYLEDEKKWIGRIEKVLIIVSAPSVIILMGAYNYIRAQTNLETKGFVSLIVDFFYKQGTTFDTLGFGYNMLPKLPFVEIKNYTFGGFIDFFKYSIIGKIFFNGTTIPTNNSPEQGMMTNSMAHNLAYVYRKNEYLNGNGNGSSYLLELFADYNYLGVIIGSILLGIILVYLVFLMKRNNAFLSSLILISISNIFFVPRSEATGWIQFIIKPRFILSMGICFIGAYLISKILRKCYSGGKL